MLRLRLVKEARFSEAMCLLLLVDAFRFTSYYSGVTSFFAMLSLFSVLISLYMISAFTGGGRNDYSCYVYTDIRLASPFIWDSGIIRDSKRFIKMLVYTSWALPDSYQLVIDLAYLRRSLNQRHGYNENPFFIIYFTKQNLI